MRHVFRSYLALGSVRLLQEQLAVDGVRSKAGQPLSRGALYTLLGNRLYRGEVAHKGAVHPGEHAAIVDRISGTRCRPAWRSSGRSGARAKAPAARACWSGCCTTAAAASA